MENISKMEIGNKVKIIKSDNELFKGKTGIIKDFTGEDNEYAIVKVTFDFSGETKSISEIFPLEDLELYTEENLNESLEKDIPEQDFIHDYVYLVDLDDNEIPSWFFTAKIAVAENIDEDVVLNTAKQFKYKLYQIMASEFCNTIVVAPKFDINQVYDEYANFLQGKVLIQELNI